VISITETTNYSPNLSLNQIDDNTINLVVYPNPAKDFIAIQSDLLNKNLNLELINELVQMVLTSQILQGSTLSILETYTLYNGIHF